MEPPTTEQIIDAIKALGLTIGATRPGYDDAREIASAAKAAHIQAVAAKIVACAPTSGTPQREGYLSCLSAMYCALVTTSVESEAVWQARKKLEDV